MKTAVRVACLVFLGMLSALILPPTASAFCNGEYGWRISLTNQNGDIGTVLINNTYGIDLWDEGPQYIWGPSAANYFCYDPANSSAYDLFRDETKVFMDVEEGNGTDYGTWPESLVLGLHLNDCSGTNCPDFSIYSGTATKTAAGNPANASTPCLVSGCQDFSGVNDEGIDVTGDQTDIETGESLTMVAWGRPALPTEAYASIMMKGSANYDFLIGGSEELTFTLWNETNYKLITATANSVITYGNDYFWTASYDASTGNTWLYQNGTDITSTRAPSASARDMTGNVHIGHNDPGTVAFKDYMDEIRIYNVSWTQANVTAFYWNLNGSKDYSTLGAPEEQNIIMIDFPTNTTYTTDPVDFNWSNTSDIDSVWYSFNGAANITLTDDIQIYPVVGSNHLIIFANESDQTNHSENVFFTFSPTITTLNITQPNNGSYISPPLLNITFDYVSARSCDTTYYSLDGATNVSYGCANFTVDMSASATGMHNITIWANNTEAFTNSDFMEFHFVNPIINCSDAGAVTAVTFTFYDEDTLATMNGSAEYAITTTDAVYSFTYTYNLSVTNATDFSVCIGDDAQTVDMTMIYDSTYAAIYDQRTYYFYQAALNSTLQSIPLYLIPSADSGKLEINIRDTNDQNVVDAYVNIQRYYVAENAYRAVAIGKTDSNGRMLTYIYTDTIFYKFVISLAGVTSSTAGPMVIIDTTDDPEMLVLYTTSEREQVFEIRESVGAYCYINYTTNYTICTVNDASGLLTSARLIVKQFSFGTGPTICDISGSGSAFTLSCFLGVDANGTYSYRLIGTPSPNPPYTMYSGSATWPGITVFGDYGLFPAFMLVLAIALMFAINPALGGITAVIGIGAASLLGIVAIGPTSIVSLTAIALIIFFKRRGS